MLNCEEFRRQLLADPFEKNPTLSDHEAGCTACSAFARDLRAQEIRLRAVLQQISAPQGMADRARHAARAEHRHDTLRRWGLSAAAGVLMIISLGVAIVMPTHTQQKNSALAQSILHHIETESHHLGNERPIASRQVNAVFDRFGAKLSAGLDQITFAAECLMRQHTGVHLIKQGKVGPVSIFFMPGEPTDRVQAITTDGLAGAIVPTTWGSLAVVGERGEEIDGLGRQLIAATYWPAIKHRR